MLAKEMKTMQKLTCLSIKTEPNSGIETNLLNAERVEWGWIYQVTGEIKKTGCGLLGREAGQRSVPVGLNIGYNFKSHKLGLPLVFSYCYWIFNKFNQVEQFLKSPSAIWQRVTIFNHGCHQTDHMNNHWALERVIQTRVCVCVPLPPFLVPLFPSLYCRACQTAELSQQGVRLWKGRERDRGGRNQMIEGNLSASVLRDVWINDGGGSWSEFS